MGQASGATHLDRPVDPAADHVLGPASAPITLVEYGSYACRHCRAATDTIAELRAELGDRLLYVFRNKPLSTSLARRAAELAERAPDAERFWRAHVALMTRSSTLTEDDLVAVAHDLGLEEPGDGGTGADRARARVDADAASAEASGVLVTPTFFINGRRYEGLWDRAALGDALLGSLGHRVRSAALDFARWAPSAGLLLLLATLVALAVSNSGAGPWFASQWERTLGVTLGERAFALSLLEWVNDGLLTVFFLVVGLEIKREFTVGHLARLRAAALPVAAALGGMAVPVLLYRLVLPDGPWARGWGVPMATDTAFAIAILVMLGSRVPVELRVFLTAASIADDIGAIVVVALFYSGPLHGSSLLAAAAIVGLLAVLSRAGVQRATPYVILGVALWACVHACGLHATLAGVILAFFIPTRPPPDLRVLTAQATAIISTEARREAEALRHGLSTQALRSLDAIHDRLESPADRMLRTASLRSSYLVLPVFALANAGVVLGPELLRGHGRLQLAIVLGLVLGKPLGVVGASWLAVRTGLAVKPPAYSWRQVLGAGALAGIGFTMSLFIAGQSFPVPGDFAAAKVAVFGASVASAALGAALLATASSPSR
ncbi:MAG TPA: Na+/H+ antiporter NhaA [Anaeromyxobacteraceae bacterium]|nr:Na+/H+ antiporter NhaA [Anaeromyxobacteraceae bacterium]